MQTRATTTPSFEVEEPRQVTVRHKKAAAVVVGLAVSAGALLVGTAEAVAHKVVDQEAFIGSGLIGVCLLYGAYRYAQDAMSESYLEGKRDQSQEESSAPLVVEQHRGGQQIMDRV